VVAGLQRSGGTEAGRTSDWNCRRQGKSERELQGCWLFGLFVLLVGTQQYLLKYLRQAVDFCTNGR